MGVMVHALDATEDEERPWRAGSLRADIMKDRMSASLVFKEKGTNSFGGGGVILNPNHNRVLCFYGGDGGTRGKLCHPPGVTETCIPGCHERPTDKWCDASRATTSWCDGLPWHPEEMSVAVRLDSVKDGYNEIVLDAEYWNAHLPHSIDALLTTPNNPTAEAMHRKFLFTYRLTAEDVPLVVFNKDRSECPFQQYGTMAINDPNMRLDYRVNGRPEQWIDPFRAAPAHPRCGNLA